MHSRHKMLLSASSLLLLTFAGCYPFHPYGGSGYPGNYNQPPGSIVTPQGPSLGTPTPITPHGDLNSGANGNWKQPSQGNESFSDDNSAPAWGTDSDSVESFKGNGSLVPDPIEAPNINNREPSSPGDELFNDDTSFNDDDTSFNDDEPSPFSEDAGASLQFKGGRKSGAEADNSREDGFQPPLEVRPVSNTKQIGSTGEENASDGPTPYDYDRKEYRFLRGLVEYDARDKAWHLMYSDRPDETDRLGGDIALNDHPGLRGLRDHEVVYVEGHVDTQSRDAYGKPRYQIDHMQRLVPKK